MSDEIVGVIAGTSDKWGKNSIIVDGVYYSNYENKTPYPQGCVEGATVRISYTHNPKYKAQLWKGITVVSSDTPAASVSDKGLQAAPKQAAQKSYTAFPVPYNDKGTSISRQNALTNAVNFFANVDPSDGSGITPEDIIALAKEFAAYTTGIVDAEEAEALQKAIGG